MRCWALPSRAWADTFGAAGERGAREGAQPAVVAIVALLAAIAAPSMRRGVRRARIAVCASNTHQNLLALRGYGADHRAFLPLYADQYNGNWLWDPPHKMRKAMMRHGATRETMYCPDCPARFFREILCAAVIAVIYHGGDTYPPQRARQALRSRFALDRSAKRDRIGVVSANAAGPRRRT